MHLPDYAAFCIDRLEHSGFAAYAVGGCVRDAVLGLIPHDYDLCTAAKPEEICRIFADFPLVKAGQKHGTVGVVLQGQVCEITTFRTEGGYLDSRHPDWVAFVDDIEKDLARRDFTVNAMAFSPTRGICDPFNGRKDLKNGVLRAVGDPMERFSEDALRILRGIRFAARYRLRIEKQTLHAMYALAPKLENIAAERIFDELCRFLPVATAEDLAAAAPILVQVIPELSKTVGFEQHNPHHAYDVFTHIAHVVEDVPTNLPLRWAALLHDVAKPATFTLDETGCGHFYGHAQKSAEMANGILRRLKAPNALREKAVLLIGQHMTKIEPEAKLVRRWLGRLGGENMRALLALQEADMGSKGGAMPEEIKQFDCLRALAAQVEAENACLSIRDLAVNGHDLMAIGYAGPQIGQALQRLLDMVLDEKVPNETEALLAALRQ